MGRGGRLFEAGRLLSLPPNRIFLGNMLIRISLKSPFLVVSETFRKDIGSSILRG